MPAALRNRKALFLDRDGTLIVHRDYLADPAGVELLPGVRATLHAALADGYRLFLFTNQSGVARGYYTMAAVEACNARLLELLALPAPGFSGLCVAPEAPDGPKVYRKPSPRFILEMIAAHDLVPAQSWMIGNHLSDVQAGLNAGIPAALVHAAADVPTPPGVRRCADLAEFYRDFARPAASG
ncbi:MAG: HAD-IIIA family hydrolase [Opitutae bacterium]|nr:HAD-IIIA family hydrolase [Opitutae bacterium]